MHQGKDYFSYLDKVDIYANQFYYVICFTILENFISKYSISNEKRIQMESPGYYALPLSSLPTDVFQNFNQLTLFQQPNNRLIQLANEIVTQGIPVLPPPTTTNNPMYNLIKVRRYFRGNAQMYWLGISKHFLSLSLISWFFSN